jgi:hypothetical protein
MDGSGRSYLHSAEPDVRALKRGSGYHPKRSCSGPSFDHLVGARGQTRRHFKPKRLGGLQIDHELEPGRLHDRKVGGLGALENAAGVDAGLTIGVHKVSSVADQTAGRGELAQLIDRGDGVACRQRDNLIAPAAEERVGADEQCSGSELRNCRKCRIEVALAAGVEDLDLLPECARCRLQVSRLGLGVRKIRIQEHGDHIGLRYQFP